MSSIDTTDPPRTYNTFQNDDAAQRHAPEERKSSVESCVTSRGTSLNSEVSTGTETATVSGSGSGSGSTETASSSSLARARQVLHVLDTLGFNSERKFRSGQVRSGQVTVPVTSVPIPFHRPHMCPMFGFRSCVQSTADRCNIFCMCE